MEAGLFAAAIAVPTLLIALLPRRWVILAMAVWTVSPLFAFIGVLVWETITRPEVTLSFENALLGFSLISAIFIVPWGLACIVGFGIGFALRSVFRRNWAGAARPSQPPASVGPSHVAPSVRALKAPSHSEAPVPANDTSSDHAGDGEPHYRHISPDGTIQIDFEAAEWGNSHWVYAPRVIDLASGRVVLDLWGMDWDATISWPSDRRIRLDFRRYHFSGDLTIELDLANDRYRIVREMGGLGELPSGPLADAASAMEASGRRTAVWAAANGGDRPVWDAGGKPGAFAAWRSALVILLVAIILIAVATTIAMNLRPAAEPQPVLLRPIPKADLSSSERLRATALKESNHKGTPVR